MRSAFRLREGKGEGSELVWRLRLNLSYELLLLSRLTSFRAQAQAPGIKIPSPSQLDSRVPIGRAMIGGNSTRQSRG